MAQSKIDKEALRQKILSVDGLDNETRTQLLGLLNEKKRYGLVWEDKPEDVEEQLREKLPVLKEVSERRILSDDAESPNHILIEGDNLHALTALTYTHEGKVDVIYIDPPYNTGNKDFIYNDSFVDAEDGYRHSKWLSFMSKRLRIAKKLLSDKGVIFISIDDNEQANLKLLCDEVFWERNFIAQLIWAGGRKNDSKYVSVSHEYALCYVKNIEFIKENKIVWRERKQGLDDIYRQHEKLKKKYVDDYKTITEELKKWYKQLPDGHPAKNHSHYSVVDQNGIYFPADISWPGGGGPKYELLHPITKKAVAIPSRGFITKKETMIEWVAEGRVHFGPDETYVPCLKSYLKNREESVPYSVIYQDGRAASKRLVTLFGKKVFDNPKDEDIIKRFISFSSKNKNSLILDFFAGSGTTLHATMQLNAEDGGKRQCILVTNNENNICEEVTYERNKRVINGYTTPKGEHVEGLKNNNLRYYKMEFVDRERTPRNMRQLVSAATDLLCIKENLYDEKSEFGALKLKLQIARYFVKDSKQMLVIYREETIERFVEEIEKMDVAEKIKIYLFSPGRYAFDDEFFSVQDKVTLCALPAAIYDAYQLVLPEKPDRLLDENEETTKPAVQGALFDEKEEEI